MFIMSRSLVVEEKLNRLANGYTAFAETDRVINSLKEEIEKQEIPVIFDETDSGCWFIPDIQ